MAPVRRRRSATPPSSEDRSSWEATPRPRSPRRSVVRRTTLRRGLRRRRGVASQLELSSDDSGVAERRRRTGAIGDCGEADEISYREGGENAMHDSPAVRVYIAGL